MRSVRLDRHGADAARWRAYDAAEDRPARRRFRPRAAQRAPDSRVCRLRRRRRPTDGLVALERYFLEKPDLVLLDLVMTRHERPRRADEAPANGSRPRASSSSPPTCRIRRASWRRPPARRGFVTKPVDREQLLKAVADALEVRRMMELTAVAAGRARRAAEHRVRPRGGVAVAADRTPRLLEVPQVTLQAVDEVGDALERVVTGTSPACTRFSPVRSPATRC